MKQQLVSRIRFETLIAVTSEPVGLVREAERARSRIVSLRLLHQPDELSLSAAVLDERPRCQGHKPRFAYGIFGLLEQGSQPGAEAIEMLRRSP